MAFDGITIAAMVKELHLNLDGGRFNKIAQPEADELLITGKGANGQCRLLLSASASLPLIYFTSKNKPSPMTAPNFCMLLRKHIGSARVSDIRQPGMERVVMFELEHLNELGDPCKKVLIMELMGKHSNIIFCDDKGMILDSIKHVSSHMSSVMLCAGSHVMFPGLFTLLLLESVRLLRRRSVSGLRSTEVMQRSLWMRRRGCICIIRSAG